MHLYDARVDRFIEHASAGQIADLLQKRMLLRYDAHTSPSEAKSWANSLGAFAEALSGRNLDDSWLILEYQLPLSSARIDAMVIGANRPEHENAVILEFKQWDRCTPTYVPGVVQLGQEDHLHPSAQARAYRTYLADTHEAFTRHQIELASCCFLHNVRVPSASGFFHDTYSPLLADSPAFTSNTIDELAHYIGVRTGEGASRDMVQRVINGRYRPSKTLLNHVVTSIEKHEPWRLLDVQLQTYNRIFADIQHAKGTGRKHVIIVTGGPGTGKSIIAIQAVGHAARLGYNVAHATGSKAFTTNMKGVVGKGEKIFRSTHQFRDAEHNELDLIVVDEAHRLRKRTQFGPRIYSKQPQAEEIIRAARVAVFLLDHQQSVRKNEIGSPWTIHDYAVEAGASISMYDLATQFRCAGSESYIRWVEYALNLSDEEHPPLAWKRNGEYDMRIFDDISEMHAVLREKHKQGESARLIAGYCWQWNDPLPDGTLVPDVQIGDWSMPWNKKPGEMRKPRRKQKDAREHEYTVWATQPEGFEQVGCIYSAQGFEFDYVGVIVGRDLRWDPSTKRWIADWRESHDRSAKSGLTKDQKQAVEKLSNTYRVLATRGMKGTYFYFLDKETRDYFERQLHMT